MLIPISFQISAPAGTLSSFPRVDSSLLCTLYKHLLLTPIIQIIKSTAITIYCFSHPLLDGIVIQSEYILVIIAFTASGKVTGICSKY